MHMLMADGLPDRDMCEDVMLLFHLLDENQHKSGGSYELKLFAQRFLDERAKEAELKLMNLLADRGLDKGEMAKLDPSEVADYASDDVFYTEWAREYLLPAAREWELEKMWHEVSEYSLVTRRFEERGIPLDIPLIHKLIKHGDKKLAEIKTEIDQAVGYEINLRSNPQIQKWLGLPSTAEDYIDEVEWRLEEKQRHEIKRLQDYRKWDKASNSYYKPMLATMDSNGISHPSILLHGTISGRPSQRGTPNWFAIPRQTSTSHEAYRVKDCVLARPGRALISSDYSQMELRLGANYSNDQFLIQCFKDGKSPHKLMLADLEKEGVDIDYDDTKRVNFAIMYGTGAPTLSKELKKGEDFARQVLKIAHGLHPNYRPMLKSAEATAKEYGFIRMWSGRVRHFNTLPDPRPWFHKACSNLIQGGTAEVLRHAILRLARILPEYDAHMILQVYDQILIDAPKDALPKVVPIVEREMTRDFDWCSVPFAVETKTGQRWGTLK